MTVVYCSALLPDLTLMQVVHSSSIVTTVGGES